MASIVDILYESSYQEIKWKINKTDVDEVLKSGQESKTYYSSDKDYQFAITKGAGNILFWIGLESNLLKKENVSIQKCIIHPSTGPQEVEFIKQHDVNNIWLGSAKLPDDDLKNDKYYIDDYLHVQYNVKIVKRNPLNMNRSVVDHPKLDENYQKLFESGKNSDVTFIVAGKEIKAHRGILLIRCEYFEAMFSEHFKERSATRIEIKNVEPEIFEHVMKYLYANRVPSLSTPNLKMLLIAADRFGLTSLVQECENQLCQNISLDNIVNLFQFAETFSQKNLKQMTMKFIKENNKQVTSSDSWKELKASHPALIIEYYETMYEKNQ